MSFKSYKTGDTGETLTIQIVNKVGRNAQPLTDATAQFKMQRVNDDSTVTQVVDAPAALVDLGADGKVQYEWQTGDLSVVGDYICTFTITYSGGKVETYPREGYIEVQVEDDL